MDKLIGFICDELEELERKADKEGKLSMAELQYGDTLAHFKKNLLKAEEMSNGYSKSMGSYGEGSYRDGSYGNGSYRDGSYERGYSRENSYRRGRRGANQYGSYAQGGYSRDHEMVAELRELMEDAPNEHVRKEFERLISKIESM